VGFRRKDALFEMSEEDPHLAAERSSMVARKSDVASPSPNIALQPTSPASPSPRLNAKTFAAKQVLVLTGGMEWRYVLS
jgi:hypothetical protein